jgi:ferric-dicitrate binding protein FerR (iron transport regulator)
MTNKTEIDQRIADLVSERGCQKQEDQIVEARRIFFEMERIDSIFAFSKVQKQIQRSQRTYYLLNTISRIAAVLFIPLLVASAWLFYMHNKSPEVQQYSMQEISSPPGIRSQVVLPDGSKVWLNAESTIKFSNPFHKESRDVELIGEAFFDVTKNPEQPFNVQSGKVKVEVLGTRFNFKAFAGDPNIEVILEEGKIALNMQYSANQKDLVMTPGDHLVYEKESNNAIVRNEDIENFVAWHLGKLVFSNTPMAEVAQMLERWYGIEVIIKDMEIMDYRFTTTFDNESLFQVIELLGVSSPVQIKYISAAVGRENQSHTRSKVIISKK